MWTNLIPVIILVFVVFIGFAGYSSAKNKTESSPSAFDQLSKMAIDQQLSDLEKPAYDYEDQVSAMCYSRAPEADMRAEYYCPVCHNLTLYPSGFYYSSDIDRISGYRTAVSNIKNIDVKLDESEYCRTCSPKAKNPQLYLIVNYSEKAKDHKTHLIRFDDIKILQAFSEGKKTYTLGSYDAEFPLKDKEKRLEELLGVDVDL